MKKRYIAAALLAVCLGTAAKGALALRQYQAQFHETITVMEGSDGRQGGVRVVTGTAGGNADGQAEAGCIAAIRSESQYEAYAYIALRIPVILAGFNHSPERILCDAAVPQINTEHWQLIRTVPGSGEESCSCYLYRLRETLAPGEESPVLFSDMNKPDFDALDERFSGTIALQGCLLQRAAFSEPGGLERADAEAAALLGGEII